ncbi:unnamed protein product [Diamesa serratosioi]
MQGEDATENMAALALSIAVGGNDDPKEIKGLSHFLEHMVSMGSEKYPEENDFMQYIFNEGGSTNAFTTTDFTIYYFNLNEEAFVSGMDRLSQFLVAPLLLKDSVDREIESVESEFQMRVNINSVRKERLMYSLAHEDHPINSFVCGNLTTLRNNTTVDEVYKKLTEHREKYYVANRMKLCIQSHYEHDRMQKLVEEYFGDIIIGEPAPVYDENEHLNIFKPEFHEKMIYMKSVDNEDQLTLTWIKEQKKLSYICKPTQYICDVLNSEEPGSLISYLKEKQLVMSFNASDSYDSSYSFFVMTMVLTKHGLKNIDEIMESISSYCYLLKQTSIEDHETLYNNSKELKDINYLYSTEETEVRNVISGVVKMSVFADEHIINGNVIFIKFDGAAITKVIDILNDNKFNVLLMTKDYDNFDKKEKYFGTEYASVDMPEKYVQLWNEKKINPALSMPAINPFICSNFDIHENTEQTEFPVSVLKNDTCEVWHKLDDQFKLPVGYVNVQLTSPKSISTANDSILLELYQRMMEFHLEQKLHSAKKASFKYVVELMDLEIVLSFKGYNEKLIQIVDIVTKEMRNFSAIMDEALFENIKKSCHQSHETLIQDPDHTASDTMDSILETKNYPLFEKLKKMDNIKFDDLKKFLDVYFDQLEINILVQGNVTKDQAVSIGNLIVNNFEAGRVIEASEIEIHCRQVKVGNTCLKIKSFMNNDKNTSTRCYYQIGPSSLRDECLVEFMINVITEPLFDLLRTKDQLGYSVDCELLEISGILGIVFGLTSLENNHSSAMIRARIERFVVEDLKKILEEMTEERFNTIKNAQIKMNHVADVQLMQQIKRNWSEITLNQFNFNHRALNAELLATFTKADLLNLYYSKMNTSEARKLTIQLIGSAVDEIESNDDQQLNLQLITENDDDQTCGTLITDIEEYKKDLFVHPTIVFKV